MPNSIFHLFAIIIINTLLYSICHETRVSKYKRVMERKIDRKRKNHAILDIGLDCFAYKFYSMQFMKNMIMQNRASL
jgi:hypothetical protein